MVSCTSTGRATAAWAHPWLAVHQLGSPQPLSSNCPGSGPRWAPLGPAGSAGFLGAGSLPPILVGFSRDREGGQGQTPGSARRLQAEGGPVSLPRLCHARGAARHGRPHLRAGVGPSFPLFAGEMRVGTSQSAILLVSAEGVFRWPGARSDLVNIPCALGKGETPPLLASACRQRQPHPGGPRCRSDPLPR